MGKQRGDRGVDQGPAKVDLWTRAQAIGTFLAAIVALLGLLVRRDLPAWAVVLLVILAVAVAAPAVLSLRNRWIQIATARQRRQSIKGLAEEFDRIIAALPQWLETNKSDNFVLYIRDALGRFRGGTTTIRPVDPVLYQLHLDAAVSMWSRPGLDVKDFEAKVRAFDTFLRIFHENWVTEPLRWLVQHKEVVPEDCFPRIKHHKLTYDTFLIRYTDLCREIERRTGITRLASWTYDRGPEF